MGEGDTQAACHLLTCQVLWCQGERGPGAQEKVEHGQLGKEQGPLGPGGDRVSEPIKGGEGGRPKDR